MSVRTRTIPPIRSVIFNNVPNWNNFGPMLRSGKNKRRREVELGRYCSDMSRGMRYPNRIVGLDHDGDIGLNLPPSIARSRTDEHAFWLHTRANERLP